MSSVLIVSSFALVGLLAGAVVEAFHHHHHRHFVRGPVDQFGTLPGGQLVGGNLLHQDGKNGATLNALNGQMTSAVVAPQAMLPTAGGMLLNNGGMAVGGFGTGYQTSHSSHSGYPHGYPYGTSNGAMLTTANAGGIFPQPYVGSTNPSLNNMSTLGNGTVGINATPGSIQGAGSYGYGMHNGYP